MTQRYVSLRSLNSPQQMGAQALTVSSTNWATAPVTPVKTRERKTKTVKRVVYPIFHQYAASSTDEYWREFFTKAGYGKLPAKFSMKDGNLIYKKGNTIKTLELPLAPAEGLWAAMTFFRTHAGICSPQDQERIQQEDRSMEAANTNPNPQWKDISRKMRSTYIELFVEELRGKYDLNNKQRDLLRQVVNLGISQHYFTSENIVFQNGRIVTIQGLLYDSDPERKAFYIDRNLRPRAPRTSGKTASSRSSLVGSTDDGTPQCFRKFRKFIRDQEKKVSREPGVRIQDPSLFSETGDGSISYSQSPTLTIVDESI